MEILYIEDSVMQGIVTIHTRKDQSAIAAIIEMNIANSLRIIQRTCEMDRIIDITGDWLVRCYQSSYIFHARSYRIDLQIQSALTSKAHNALDQPGFIASIFHGKGIDVHTIQTAAGRTAQRMERLLEKLAIDCRELRFNRRIL